MNIFTPQEINDIRRRFPILEREVYGRRLVYLDNAATSQTPVEVVRKLDNMYTRHHANVHRGVHCMSQEATDLQEETRSEIARYINAESPEQVIFTRGTTEGINLVADCYCRTLAPGSRILLTEMEHHSNIVPWQLAAQRNSLEIDVVPIEADGSLDMGALRRMLTPEVKVVAVTHVSNVLGTVNPVEEICRLAHANGSVALIDGAQAMPHYTVDVQKIGADFYVFSGHKMYGPTGVGVLYGRRSLLEAMPPYMGGGEMIDHVSFQGTTFAPIPFKFEAGTPDYTGIPAMGEALKFIREIGMERIEAHEMALYNHAVERIAAELPQVRILGTAPGKCPVLSFLLGNAHAYDTGLLLDKLGVAVRTGHHCAQPLMKVLGITGCARASFAVYNTMEEADALVDGLLRISPML